MRILFFFSKFTQEHVTKDIGQLFKLLGDLGNSVTIVTYSAEENKDLSIPGVAIIRIEPPFLSGTRLFSKFLPSIDLLRFLVNNRSQWDCVFSVFHDQFFVQVYFKLLCHNPLSIIKLDSDGIYYKGRQYFLKKMFGTILFFVLYHLVDKFLIETPEAKAELLSRHSWLSNKLTFLPSGINFENYHISTEKNFCDGENILFVCGSTDIASKGIDLLISAFQNVADQFPKWILKIVGDIPSNYRKEFQNIIMKKLGSRIHFLGKMTLNEICTQYQAAEIYCYPGTRASFGLTIPEAMFFGKPIISSNVGVAKFALCRRAGLVVEKGSVQALSLALKTLMEDENLRNEMGKIAELRCKQLFDFRKIACSLNDIIIEIKNRK